MSRFRVIKAIAAISIVLTYIGCSKNPTGLYQVSGRVTINGIAAKHGRVTFYPTNGERPASGQIIDGQYYLTTFNSRDGAFAGEHIVTIKCIDNTDVSNDSELGDISDLQQREMMIEQRSERDRLLLPTKYSSKETSPIRRTVVENQENKFDFESSHLPAIN